ncbi:MAG: DUF1963 domain-containing protein [Candidatus Eremiobacteraeota bacterium]|nr:DUF1963 domain-containing protein [Candidatus Eremiobacteraeota bacterium]
MARTFSLDLPAELVSLEVEGDRLRAECGERDFVMQPPELNLARVALADYDEFEGSTFEERLRASLTELGELTFFDPLEIEVDGRSCLLQQAEVVWDWPDRQAKVFYLIGALPLDQTSAYLMRAFCEVGHKPEFVPLFMDAFRSLRRVRQFRVDGNQLAGHLEAEISELDHALAVSLTAPAAGLPADLSEEDLVGFRLRAHGIYRRGVPVGVFEFDLGYCEDLGISLSNEGWNYSLEFTGSLTLGGGWLRLEGHLTAPLASAPRYEILIAQPFELAPLDWSVYRFGTLAETDGADPASVCHLELEGEDTIGNFANLRSLRLRRGEGPLPAVLSNLTQLESLEVWDRPLTTLPDLSRLTRLHRVSLNHCDLATTPASLWRLPRLTYLNLEYNRLTELPAAVDLPELISLELANNLLTTLPEQLALAPKLEFLSLEENPLESLPTAYNEVKTLDLSMEDKLRLLDFSYPGLEPWDDSVYWVQADPELVADWKARIAEAGFEEQSDALCALARKSVSLEPLEEAAATVGCTRFGGWPDLPASIAYPRFVHHEQEYAFEFIAQLDCAELASLQAYLPRQGHLYFFIDTVHQLTPLVLYSLEQPVSGAGTALTAEDFFDFSSPPSTPHRVEAWQNASLPNTWAPEFIEDQDLFEEMIDCLVGEDPLRCHELNSYVFTQHESPELQAALALRGNPEDWMVLLKVGSLGGFNWGDAGELFFVIHKSALQKCDFSRVYCNLESS